MTHLEQSHIKSHKRLKITAKLNKRGFLTFLELALVSTAMILFIINPSTYMHAFSNGLQLFVTNVLPALFPFMFFTKLLTSLGLANKLGKALSKPMQLTYRTPSVSGYILVMSMLSGYPIGATLTADLYSKGFLTKDDALAISSFTSTSGPLFVLGTVGAIYNNYKFALLLLVANYLSAFINGLIFKNKKLTNWAKEPPKLDSTLNSIMYDSTLSILIVGGYIALFNLVVDMLCNVGIANIIGNAFDNIFTFVPNGTGFAAFVGVIEMTRGTIVLSDFGINHITATIQSFILTFGGIGIALQSYTFLQKCNIKFASFLVRKLSQALIAALISIPLYWCFFS